MQYSSRYTVKNSFRLQSDASLLRTSCKANAVQYILMQHSLTAVCETAWMCDICYRTGILPPYFCYPEHELSSDQCFIHSFMSMYLNRRFPTFKRGKLLFGSGLNHFTAHRKQLGQQGLFFLFVCFVFKKFLIGICKKKVLDWIMKKEIMA